MDIALSARFAVPTENDGIDRHPVAHFYAGHAFSDFGDLAGEFMAHNHRGDSPAGNAEIPMNVRTADSAGPDADQGFSGRGLYISDFIQPQVFRAIVDECFHLLSLILINDSDP
jgi:hypothetical protein